MLPLTNPNDWLVNQEIQDPGVVDTDGPEDSDLDEHEREPLELERAEAYYMFECPED